ncbi:nucleotidyltransferase family protein [Sphingorhabdus sp.]|uniref:nucleotidyltransferase family protein n=1 Tax=Sphingorhabdus sp. TaxID=1902408 RepID=UPI0035B0B325
MNDESWRRAILPLNSTIQDAIRNLTEVAIKICLVADDEGCFVGTISDGDIRRGLLRGLALADSISGVIHRNALVLPPAVAHDLVMRMMAVNKIQQIPVVDEANRLVGLHLWDKMVAPQGRQNMMVIMAGGKGTRLRPHTEDCPKPMLLVSGKPMLEHIILRAKFEGFVNFVLAIHYLGHMVEEYFGDGSRLGVHIDYLREQTPLGTAGALSLFVQHPEIPFVVTNGDVLTDIRYGELLDFHCMHAASATMAVRVHEWQHPFGVVQLDGVDIVGFEEKPIARSHINAGVYVLDGSALDVLAPSEHCDMPVLFQRLQERERRTVAYPMHEPWLDVGRPEDLKRARDEG